MAPGPEPPELNPRCDNESLLSLDSSFIGARPGQRKRTLKWYHWAVLISVDTLGPFSTDSYIPNMPKMVQDLDTTWTMAGLTLQLNWLVQGIFNIILGRLADKVGRRPVVIGSFVIYIIAALGCNLAPTVEWFILARCLQGVGQASAVITSAIARDAIDDKKQRMRLMSLLGTIRPWAMITAPSIGGLLGSRYGWRWVFGLLCGWGVMNLILSYFLLPETSPSEDEAAEYPPSTLLRDLKRLFTGRLTGTLMFVFAIKFSAIQCMLSTISGVLENHFGLGEVVSSVLIGSLPACIILGSGVVAIFAKDMPPLKLLRNSLVGTMIVALLMFGLAIGLIIDNTHVPWVAAMAVFYAMVLHDAISTPPLMTLFMQPVKDIAGLASGAQSFTHAMISTVLAFLATWCFDHYQVKGLLISIVVVLTIAGLIFFCGLGCAADSTELEIRESASFVLPRGDVSMPNLIEDSPIGVSNGAREIRGTDLGADGVAVSERATPQGAQNKPEGQVEDTQIDKPAENLE